MSPSFRPDLSLGLIPDPSHVHSCSSNLFKIQIPLLFPIVVLALVSVLILFLIQVLFQVLVLVWVPVLIPIMGLILVIPVLVSALVHQQLFVTMVTLGAAVHKWQVTQQLHR